MQKVLIIAYFFPPNGLTASSRAKAWFDHLHKYGYYPIVLTRHWDVGIKGQSDLSSSSSKTSVEVEKYENGEIIRMPYKSSLRDRIYVRHGDAKFVFFRKVLSFAELLLSNFTRSVLPYKSLYYKALELVQEDGELNKIVITANPFPLFGFGYSLKRKIKRVNWIADYRDDWSTTELVSSRSFLEKIIFSLEARNEKKWLSNSSIFTSVSPHYVSKISNYIKKDGRVLLNGYDFEGIDLDTRKTNPKEFKIAYNGTLYNSQDLEGVVESVKKLIERYDHKVRIMVCFYGAGYDPFQKARVEKLFEGYQKHFLITERMPRPKVVKFQLEAQVLLMLTHKGLKGIPSSKLYEYIGLRKPILLFPNDHDIVHETLDFVGGNLIANNEKDLLNLLSGLVEEFLQSGMVKANLIDAKVESYKREFQVGELAKYLDSLGG